MTIQNNLVKLLATFDHNGYISYVFKYLDEFDVKKYKDKVIICTRYPNWDCRELKVGDIGYVEIEVVRAGIDTYYDGEKQVPYRNNAKRFIKFVDKPKSENPGEYTL